MIINKISKTYDIHPEYLSVDWFGEPDGEGGFIPRDDVIVIDESTTDGFALAQKIISYHPYVELIIDNDQLIDVQLGISIKALRDMKIQEIKTVCNAEITSGFESSAKGYPEFYGLDYEDQINMEALKNNIVLGLIPEGTLMYYAKGKPCEPWANAEFLQLYADGMAFKTIRITRAKELIAQAQNGSTKVEIEAIQW